MNKNTAIKVQNLTKTYKLYSKPIDRLKESLHPLKKKYHKDFYALNNVSFEIKKGETVGIIGKNGSGKSTLLKIITGVLTPTSGKVNIHGKISAILELGAGFNPEMTGLENIYLNNSINGLTKEQTDKRIKDIVDFAELGEFIHQPIKTYSSGMKARLAFAVSINVDPDILIVDEALSVGDAAFARKCFAKMEEIRSKGATILFVSHSEGSIVSLCNRAIWISQGNQIIDGTPKLVTGLYMKHINDSKVDKQVIIKEYEELEKNSINEDEEKSKQEVKSKTINKQLMINNYKQATNSIEEYYDPNLKPKSTIYYEEKGAKISDVKITTLDGKEVNVLSQNKNYHFKYKISYIDSFEKVQFGMMIKDTKGTPLAGGVLPSKRNFKKIDNNNYEVIFEFRCFLSSGQYFMNCSTRMIEDGFFKLLSKISDVYTFKVIQNEDTINTATINLIMKGEINEL